MIAQFVSLALSFASSGVSDPPPYSGPCAHVVSVYGHRAASEEIAKSVCMDIAQRADKIGLDPMLAIAVARAESDFNPKARSSRAFGPLQVIPRYHCPARPPLLSAHWCTYDASINGGLRYLRAQIERFGISEGVERYNRGHVGALTDGSAEYRRRVMRAYRVAREGQR